MLLRGVRPHSPAGPRAGAIRAAGAGANASAAAAAAAAHRARSARRGSMMLLYVDLVSKFVGAFSEFVFQQPNR